VNVAGDPLSLRVTFLQSQAVASAYLGDGHEIGQQQQGDDS
jgi:hypothetical protein